MRKTIIGITAAAALSLTGVIPAFADPAPPPAPMSYGVGFVLNGWMQIKPWNCGLNPNNIMVIYLNRTQYLVTNDPVRIPALIILCTTPGRKFWVHLATDGSGAWDGLSFAQQ